MVITSINEQVKDNLRVNIFIDGKYVFALSKQDVAFYNLKEGEELSEKKYNEILDNVVLAKAKLTALSYLSYKDRTKREVIRKLKEKGFTKEVTKKTLVFLVSYGYINDLEYSKKFVKQRVCSKGYGKYKVVRELKEKGVSDEIIESVTENIEDDERETALKFATKKATKLDLKEYKDKQKLYAYLQRRGYSYEIIRYVIEEVQAENTSD